jgi:hypothetical protein
MWCLAKYTCAGKRMTHALSPYSLCPYSLCPCSGQSNMAFSVPAMTNATAEVELANHYSGPTGIRLFTVGQLTKLGSTPEDHLLSIEQNWTVASGGTVVPPGPGNICDNCPAEFKYFSAVCWVFGRTVHDGLGGQVPVGLISNNWYVQQLVYHSLTKRSQLLLYSSPLHSSPVHFSSLFYPSSSYHLQLSDLYLTECLRHVPRVLCANRVY